jgi:hypothetical protein
LLAAAIATFGLPSLSEPRAALDRSIGMRTDDLIDSRSTHVVGGYFEVWPAVFHANMTLHERGEDRIVWGVSHRCGPTLARWSAMPRKDMRVAVPVSSRHPPYLDDGAKSYLSIYFADFRITGRRDTVWLLGPANSEAPP